MYKRQQLFSEAFSRDTISMSNVLHALAQFQLVLISDDAKYDRYIAGDLPFSEQEERGFALFAIHCQSCHTPPLFTSHQFKRNGLSIDSVLNDRGRFEVTTDSADMLRFKIPSLRNVAYTFPYMHDGRFKTLSEVMDHYQKAGIAHHEEHEFQSDMLLSDNDKVDLIAFLRTLTDRSYMFSPLTAFPPIAR